MSIVKNIPLQEMFRVADQVQVLPGQVVSKTIVQNSSVSIAIFAFDKGEEISSHASRGDAFVTVLEGKGKFCIDGIPYVLNKGESIVMPANIPHSVFGEEQFKMLLVVLFPADSAKVEGKPIVPS